MRVLIKKLFKLILVLGFGFGLWYVYDRFFVQAYSRGELDVLLGEEPAIEVNTVLLESFDESGRKKLEIYGRKATVAEKDKTIHLKPMTIILYEEGLAGTLMLAKQGMRKEGRPEYYELEGMVEVTSRDGRKLFTQKLIYYPRLDKIVSPKEFKLIDGAHIVEGDYLEYFMNLEKGEIRGNVRMRFYEQAEVVDSEKEFGLSGVEL